MERPPGVGQPNSLRDCVYEVPPLGTSFGRPVRRDNRIPARYFRRYGDLRRLWQGLRTAACRRAPDWRGQSAPEASPRRPGSAAGCSPNTSALFVAVVCVALLTNGMFEIWFSYQENKQALIRIQREQAEAAAGKIGQFIKEIESQIGWTTQLPWSASAIEQRRFDALRLLRQVPAITELAQVDATGKEQLRVSRLAMDVVGIGIDFSKEPKFTEAVANKIYYGPVYFRRESEPYMTLVAGRHAARRRRQHRRGQPQAHLGRGVADQGRRARAGLRHRRQGRLIAHPDISLVLRNTDMSRLDRCARRATTPSDPRRASAGRRRTSRGARC